VLTERRKLIPKGDAQDFVSSLFPTCRAPLDVTTIALAWETGRLTGYGWWDCLLLAAALRFGCKYFLSEDLADGQRVLGLRILNPFTRDVERMIG
jgi:predicted nucleic acid-binding protein